jgi:hypothetical protein
MGYDERSGSKACKGATQVELAKHARRVVSQPNRCFDLSWESISADFKRLTRAIRASSRCYTETTLLLSIFWEKSRAKFRRRDTILDQSRTKVTSSDPKLSNKPVCQVESEALTTASSGLPEYHETLIN